MILNQLLQYVPHLGHPSKEGLVLDFIEIRERRRFQVVEDERFEQLKGHLLRQAALGHLELWINNDHRAPGVVNASPKQVSP